jgi:hypothetical protein
VKDRNMRARKKKEGWDWLIFFMDFFLISVRDFPISVKAVPNPSIKSS